MQKKKNEKVVKQTEEKVTDFPNQKEISTEPKRHLFSVLPFSVGICLLSPA